jgi:anti-sigma regulatory factor (Ser/Thr protein kinase)
MRITISSQARLLHVLRSVVRWQAQQAGFGDSEADCLSMAIDEAASNIIRHAYCNRPDGRLSVDVKRFDDRIEFSLEDSGPKVNPEKIRPRSLEEVRPGGLGTYFINCFMDAAIYDESFTGGNRLKLVKYLPGRGTASAQGPGQEIR